MIRLKVLGSMVAPPPLAEKWKLSPVARDFP
jgi:hypothetical protein